MVAWPTTPNRGRTAIPEDDGPKRFSFSPRISGLGLCPEAMCVEPSSPTFLCSPDLRDASLRASAEAFPFGPSALGPRLVTQRPGPKSFMPASLVPAPTNARGLPLQGLWDLPPALRSGIEGPRLVDHGGDFAGSRWQNPRRRERAPGLGAAPKVRDRSYKNRGAKIRVRRASKQRLELRLLCQRRLRPQIMRKQGSRRLRVRIPSECQSPALRRAQASKGPLVWKSRHVGQQLWLELSSKGDWEFVEAYPISRGWLAAFELSSPGGG